MQKLVAALLLILCTSLAHAQSCPPFYRFVDFGLAGSDGVTYRGGTVLRAEDFNGDALLLTEQSTCLIVRDVARDGRGNPIPIVTSIAYDPAKTGVDLLSLRLSGSEDTTEDAQESAAAHQALLASAEVALTRESTFLCASSPAGPGMSCQLHSPFPVAAPLVVYCDARECTMPVLAITDTLSAHAVWAITDALMADPQALGEAVTNKVEGVYDFLMPLSAAF